MESVTRGLKVKYKEITPKGWRGGDIVEDFSKNQYHITDAENGQATLESIAEEDKVKRKFVFFTLSHNSR